MLERAAQHDQDPTTIYAITDELTGIPYEVVSAVVELEPYASEWIAMQGVPVPGAGDPSRPQLFYAIEIDPPADDPSGGQPVVVTGCLRSLRRRAFSTVRDL